MTPRAYALTVLILISQAHVSPASQPSLESPPDEIQLALQLAFHCYRHYVSPQDIASCGFSPSCSRFAQDAIGRHGLQGLFMASDRLQRCHDCSAHLYRRDPSTGLGIDPVSNNVLWGARPPTSSSLPAAPTVRPGTELQTETDQVDYFGAGAVAEFARHLETLGDHRRAAGEYQRLLFLLEPDDPRRVGFVWRLARNLRCAGDPRLAAQHLEALPVGPVRDETDRLVARELVFCDLDRGRFADARARIEEAPETDLMAGSYLLEGRWQEADAILATAGPETPVIAGLRQIVRESREAPLRSEAVAGLMSAVVPGSGKVYAGRPTDGLFSLVAISFCTWQAIDGFEDRGSRSTKGWVFGTVAAGYHAGNIYGSVLAARIHNQNVKLQLSARTREVLVGWSCRH